MNKKCIACAAVIGGLIGLMNFMVHQDGEKEGFKEAAEIVGKMYRDGDVKFGETVNGVFHEQSLDDYIYRIKR